MDGASLEEAGRTPAPYFNKWGVTVTDAAAIFVANLPSWMPEGIKQPSAQPVNDAGLFQIVGGHLHFHAVTHGEADETFAHLA